MRRLALSLVLTCFASVSGACHPDAQPVVAPSDAQTDPDRVLLQARVGNRFVQADEAGTTLVHLTVKGADRPEQERPAANVAIVLDTSSSMEGTAIAEARRAASTLLTNLRDGDRIALIGFGSSTEVLVPSTIIDETTRGDIEAAIEGVQARGTTDLAGGLSAGLSEVTRHHDAASIERIVLLSDGVPNDESGIAQVASQAGAQNITITALGLGLQYRETLLGQIAEASGGTLHFTEDATELAAVFEEEILSVDRAVAQALQLQLRAGPDVMIEQIAGHSQLDGERMQANITLGNLAEGQTREVIVRLRHRAHVEGATLELLDARLTFQDAVAGAGGFERATFVSAKATADTTELADGRSADVELDAARAFTAADTMWIMQRARAGDLSGAFAQLDQAIERARAAVREFDDPQLAELTADLVALKKTLPELAPQAQQAQQDPTALGRPTPSPASPAPKVKVSPQAARHNRDAYTRAFNSVH